MASNPDDMILPLLREMRAEMVRRFDGTDKRLEAVESRLDAIDRKQGNFRHALIAESLTGKFLTGEFEERIEAFEAKVKELETRA